MSWSFRKSFGSGLFRINFSKSGVSYSVGVKGARVNVGPRGTYVNLSAHGISYRHKISTPAVTPTHLAPLVLPGVWDAQGNIASADVGRLTDADSVDFITELTQKARQVSYVNWLGILPLIVFLGGMILTSFGSRVVVTRPATDSILVKVTSDAGVNIREAADAKSRILQAAAYDQPFPLLDCSNRKWLKVDMKGSVGYINRHFVAIDQVHRGKLTEEQTFLANRYVGYELAGGLLGFAVLISWLKKQDKKRFELVLHYEMDEQFLRVYEQFGNHFTTFSRSARIWQYLNAQQTNEYKRTGGAGKLIKRAVIRGISGNQVPLRHFVTNIAIPCLKLSNLEFYFLPERLLVKRGNTFAAVFYRNLRILGYTTRFIEDESVPGDAQVVDQTWQYVNKHGGPDRRFNNNRQLPICAYSEYTLTSDTGIYEVITTSKKGAMDAFAGFLTQIGDLQSRMEIG